MQLTTVSLDRLGFIIAASTVVAALGLSGCTSSTGRQSLRPSQTPIELFNRLADSKHASLKLPNNFAIQSFNARRLRGPHLPLGAIFLELRHDRSCKTLVYYGIWASPGAARRGWMAANKITMPGERVQAGAIPGKPFPPQATTIVAATPRRPGSQVPSTRRVAVDFADDTASVSSTTVCSDPVTEARQIRDTREVGLYALRTLRSARRQ